MSGFSSTSTTKSTGSSSSSSESHSLSSTRTFTGTSALTQSITTSTTTPLESSNTMDPRGPGNGNPIVSDGSVHLVWRNSIDVKGDIQMPIQATGSVFQKIEGVTYTSHEGGFNMSITAGYPSQNQNTMPWTDTWSTNTGGASNTGASSSKRSGW